MHGARSYVQYGQWKVNIGAPNLYGKRCSDRRLQEMLREARMWSAIARWNHATLSFACDRYNAFDHHHNATRLGRSQGMKNHTVEFWASLDYAGII